MIEEKEKYSNGNSLDASKMSKDEIINAIEYWCEGNQALKKMLLYCNGKGIETIGCCSGHEEEYGYAYIGLKLGNPQEKEIIDLLTKLEISNIDMVIAFIRGDLDRSFVVLRAPTIGNNEKFFEDVNQCWNQNIQNDDNFYRTRKKYEMLKTVLTDKRAQEYTDFAEFSFGMADEHVRTAGFYKYYGKILNISMSEIERMGEWLLENSDTEVSKEFYGKKIGIFTQLITGIKQKCQISTIPLSRIRNAYKSIKNRVKPEEKKEKKSHKEEGVRNG